MSDRDPKTRPSSLSGLARVSEIKQATDLALSLRTWWRSRTRWSVSISSDDPLWLAAHTWFTAGVGDEPPRALQARLQRTHSDHPGERGRGELALYYDDRREREISIGGHPVTVVLARAGAARQPDNGEDAVDPIRSYLDPDVLTFHARSRDGQDAVVAMLRGLLAAGARKPAVFLLNQWGGWNRRLDLPARTLDSVVLADGQMQRLRDDLDRFLHAEHEHVRRGLPWHRGYLLHGPPGTGKTSIVRALAAHFGLDLWYAPLGDLSKDANLLTLISEVQPRSILLLEDVDVFHGSRLRDDTQSGVTLAGLMNALDGVATPHGLISVMTTNDLSVLDEALIRPGRIDLREEIGLPTWDQVVRLHAWYYDKTPHWSGRPPYPRWKGTTADLVELFKQHPDDPTGAWADVFAGSVPTTNAAIDKAALAARSRVQTPQPGETAQEYVTRLARRD